MMLLSSGEKYGANEAPGLSVTRCWPEPSAFITQMSIFVGLTRSWSSSRWNAWFVVVSSVR